MDEVTPTQTRKGYCEAEQFRGLPPGQRAVSPSIKLVVSEPPNYLLYFATKIATEAGGGDDDDAGRDTDKPDAAAALPTQAYEAKLANIPEVGEEYEGGDGDADGSQDFTANFGNSKVDPKYPF